MAIANQCKRWGNTSYTHKFSGFERFCFPHLHMVWWLRLARIWSVLFILIEIRGIHNMHSAHTKTTVKYSGFWILWACRMADAGWSLLFSAKLFGDMGKPSHINNVNPGPSANGFWDTDGGKKPSRNEHPVLIYRRNRKKYACCIGMRSVRLAKFMLDYSSKIFLHWTLLLRSHELICIIVVFECDMYSLISPLACQCFSQRVVCWLILNICSKLFPL